MSVKVTGAPSAVSREDVPTKVGVLEWYDTDGIAEMVRHELAHLGHQVERVRSGEALRADVDVLFSFGPYGALLPALQKVKETSACPGPTVLHWNTEGFPDLRMPFFVMDALGDLRSGLGRLTGPQPLFGGAISRTAFGSWLKGRASRFGYIGDYKYAYRNGLIDVLADSSEIYVDLHRRRGVPAIHLPWGASTLWYSDLHLPRDIDVLWMGKRGSARRSKALDRVRDELRANGVNMHVADNEESAFIFDEERTQFLNRAKITLNLARTWYDDNYSRFALAAPNRSLIVSELLLPHCSAYRAGVHYVAAEMDRLAATILYYLRHDSEREAIVDSAYRLVTTDLAFGNGLQRALSVATARRRAVGQA